MEKLINDQANIEHIIDVNEIYGQNPVAFIKKQTELNKQKKEEENFERIFGEGDR